MKNIIQIISKLTLSDARSTLYYLVRYLKQAGVSDDYSKNAFQDDSRSSPSETIRSAVLLSVSTIENIEGLPAAQFDMKTLSKWVDTIEELESRLDPATSEHELELAQGFLSDMELPTID